MIGPIPATPTIDGEARWGDAPGAIAPIRPAWGGYLPAREPPARGPAPGWGDSDEAHAAYAAETAVLIAAEASATDWRADTAETKLHLRDGAWYVERPARPCCRAVVIAADAIRDGAEPPPGILPEEVAKAREILASDDPRAWAWAASGGWSLPVWPLPATEPSDAEEVVSRRGDPGYYDDDI